MTLLVSYMSFLLVVMVLSLKVDPLVAEELEEVAKVWAVTPVQE